MRKEGKDFPYSIMSTKEYKISYGIRKTPFANQHSGHWFQHQWMKVLEMKGYLHSLKFYPSQATFGYKE